ncbi:MAG: zinc-ribbon domain-containing protein [Mariniblastus sp.]|nr:zinc-ribbon domain-containing protein [Mariniblastus sp.]
MKIKCPNCGKKYEIPPRHQGRKFRCPKCGKKIRTNYPTPTIVSPIPPADPPPFTMGSESPSKSINRFQKETELGDPSAYKVLKVVSLCLLGLGVLATLFLVVESQTGFVRRIQLSAEGLPLDPVQVESSSGTGLTEGPSAVSPSELKPKNETRRDPSNTLDDSVGPSVVAGSKGEVESLPLWLPVDERYGQQPCLGEIEDFDPTWFTNSPNYALRGLVKFDVNGSRMEKTARAYGSPTFIDQYRRLQGSPDFSVRFYSSIGLANFDYDIDESLLVMLEAIATDRTRVGTTKLRLDLANQLLARHHERVPFALHTMARRHTAEIKGFAIEYLANLGLDARPVASEIANALNDQRPYIPQDPDLGVQTIGDVALYCLQRLKSNAVDAVPQLVKEINSLGDSEYRAELNELVIDILTRSRDLEFRTEMSAWARGAGLSYIPASMRYLTHYRVPSLLESEYYQRLENAPAFKAAVDLLEKQCGLQLDEIEFITAAYQNSADTMWEKRPFVVVVRLLETVDSSRFGNLPAVKSGETSYLRVAPEIGLLQVGQGTLVLATEDDLETIISSNREQTPRFVLPSEPEGKAFLYATNHFVVSCDFEDERCRMDTEFEYFLPQVTEGALTLLESGTFQLPFDFPKPAQDVFQNNSSTKTLKQESRLKISHEVPIAEVPLTLIKIDWLRPFDSEGLEAWRELVNALAIERAVFSDASDRIRPELGTVNDLSRTAVADLVAAFFVEMEVGPASRLNLSGEEKTNLYRLLEIVGGWIDGSMLHYIKDYMNAVPFEQSRQIALYVNIPNSQSLKLIADNIQQVSEIDLSDENWQKLGRLLHHFFTMGDPDAVRDCLLVCQKAPHFVIEFNIPIKAIADNPEEPSELRELASDVLSVVRQIQVVEQDYSRLEEYARDSGIANYALEGHREFKGDPPKIKKLVPVREEARVFDLVLPELHPELWEIQLDGPVDRMEEEYRKVTGLKYTVRNGDVIVVQRRNHPPEFVSEDWNSSSKYLGQNLVREEMGGSEAGFDRVRYYFVQGLPKAQRLIVANGIQYEVRWMGRNHKSHPSYVEKILGSFGIRE